MNGYYKILPFSNQTITMPFRTHSPLTQFRQEDDGGPAATVRRAVPLPSARR